jgi:hypothetical protein
VPALPGFYQGRSRLARRDRVVENGDMRTTATVAGILVLLIGAYVASYYLAVRRDLGHFILRPTHLSAPVTHFEPAYPFANDYLASFFSPMHKLDRELRREFWSTEAWMRSISR